MVSNYYYCSGGNLGDHVPLKLKTCALYHENLLLKKFNDVITQVLEFFFQPLTSWRLSKAISVSIGMNAKLRDTH